MATAKHLAAKKAAKKAVKKAAAKTAAAKPKPKSNFVVAQARPPKPVHASRAGSDLPADEPAVKGQPAIAATQGPAARDPDARAALHALVQAVSAMPGLPSETQAALAKVHADTAKLAE